MNARSFPHHALARCLARQTRPLLVAVHPRATLALGRVGLPTLALFCTLAALAVGTLRTQARELICAVTDAARLVSSNSAVPGTLMSSVPVSGLQPGEILLGIDLRPASGELYGLGSSNRLYTLGTNTGGASVLGGPIVLQCFMGCEPNIIHIVYTKPVQLDGSYSTDVSIVNGVSYGANQSEVLVDIDPLAPETTAVITIEAVQDLGGTVLSPNPTTCLVRYVLTAACAPVLTCTNVVAECTGGLTPVTFSVTASNASGPVSVTCVPPSGSGFRLGTSNVVCTASNSTVTCNFSVTVVDTTPPQVTCPGDFTVQTTKAAGAVVNYTASATDPCGLADFKCSPPPGTTFSIGTTLANCTASDPSRNTNSCSFQVTVLGVRDIKLDCLTNLITLRAGVTNRHDGEDLDDAIEHLARSLDPTLWIDQIHLQHKGGDKVFEEEKKAIHELVELLQDKKSTVPDSTLHALIDCILRADRTLAELGVDDAEAAGVKPKKIAEDREELDKGNEDAAKGKYEEAIEHYSNAWKHAVHIKIDPPHQLASDGTRLTFIGIEGETYVVQAASDLVHWTTIGTGLANADGEVILDDPGASGQTSRFYRVVSQQPALRSPF